MTVLTVEVEANQDDGGRGWEQSLFGMSFDNTLGTIYIGSSDSMGGDPQDTTCYFRFLDVDIPSTATINSAKLQFKLQSSHYSSGKSCRIYADGIASSAAVTDDSEMTAIFGRLTTDYTAWDLDVSPADPDDTSSYQDSPLITDVIDEIINISGWDDGDKNITIILTDPTDADMMESWVMSIRAHEGSGGAITPVKLVIDYTAAGASTPTSPAFLLFLD